MTDIDLTSICFKQPQRVYGSSQLHGCNVVVVDVDVDKNNVGIIVNDVSVVVQGNVTKDNFFSHYLPDFGLDLGQVIHHMATAVKTVKRVYKEETKVLLEDLKSRVKKEGIVARKATSSTDPVVTRCIRDASNAIKVKTGGGLVGLITLTELGLRLVEMPESEYLENYTELPAYPLDKAAQLFVEYAKYVETDDGCLELLGNFTTLSKEDLKMANPKQQQPAEKPTKKQPVASSKPQPGQKAGRQKPEASAGQELKSPGKAKSAPSPTQAGKKQSTTQKKQAESAPAASEPAKKPSKSAPASYASASQMFQALIREGKMTDADIFSAVQKQFNLDDNKKGYVQWYRNNLRKKGEKVPDAKKA